MKVLQINAVYGHGSTGVIAKEILDEVKAIGGEAYAASAEHMDEEDQKGLSGYISIGNKFDHKLHSIKSRILGEQGFYSKSATRKLIEEVKKISPDIIHLHNLHNNYINIELLFEFIREYKINTVITLHDCWFFTGKCCHFMYDNCEKWRRGCGGCPRQKSEIPSYFFDMSAIDYEKKQLYIGSNPYVHIVGCSEWLTKCAQQSLLKNRVWGTIHNGVDVEVFKPIDSQLRTELGIGDKYVILGMANKWLADENKKTFEYIVPRLEKDSILLLIGCTKEQIKNNTWSNVLMVDFVFDRDKLAEYYSVANVFVNVTKVDSFPTVNIEALACGTPVVTYDSGGSAEMLTEETGRVVPYGDVRALRIAINDIKKMDMRVVSDKCVKLIQESYRKDMCFRKYVDLYQSILEKDNR